MNTRSDPWSNFVYAEIEFRQAVRKIQLLPLNERVLMLQNALRSRNEARIALRFLHFVEPPGSKTLARPLTYSLAPDLLEVALQSGDDGASALSSLEMVANQAPVQDLIVARAWSCIIEIDKNPLYEDSDYDTYLACGHLLAVLGDGPFKPFKERASKHSSPLIRDLAQHLDPANPDASKIE